MAEILAPLYAAYDVIFLPIITLPNFMSILIISAMITITILTLNRLLINRNVVREIKTKMEEIKENLNRAQKEGNKDLVNSLINDMMKTNNQYMRHSMKALIVSMIVISLILPWVGQKYEGLTVATLPFSAPIVGQSLPWIYWYILVSLTLGWVLNKLFGAHE